MTALLLVSTGQTLNVLLVRLALEHWSVVQMPFTKVGYVALFLAIVSLNMVNAMRPSVRRRMAALDAVRVQRRSDFVAMVYLSGSIMAYVIVAVFLASPDID
ncbi:hypothetical protein [Pseudoxanthomonas indica]|nr:hypothetical protein [Pseudoxanthomonas indica]GGD55861.1 hypothetical protein GCM10007235_30320 [Pseudoxanthomonas indica]